MGPAPMTATSWGWSVMASSYGRGVREEKPGVAALLYPRPRGSKDGFQALGSSARRAVLEDAVGPEVRLVGVRLLLVHGGAEAGVAPVPRVAGGVAGLVPAHRAAPAAGVPVLGKEGL